VSQRDESKPSLFASLGRQVGRSRSIAIGLWVLLMVASLTLTPQLERSLKGVGLTYEAGEARQTERLLQDNLGISADPDIVVFQASAGQERMQPQIERILTEIRQLPDVSSTSTPSDRPAQNTRYSIVNLRQTNSDANATIGQIQQILNRETDKTLKTSLTGKAAVDRDVLKVSKADLARAEFIALPLTLVALLFVFGSPIAATLPVAMGILTVSVTFGLLYFVAQQMEISVLALNFTSMLGLGLGVDYSLLIVNRFREELHNGSVSQAVTRTVETAGQAVFVSGITVCISLFFLLLFPVSVLRSISIAGFLVVLLSVTAALTFLPALLSLIGRRINGGRRIQPVDASAGFWAQVARLVTRNSTVSIAAVLTIVLVLSAPFLRIHFGLGDVSILPRSVSSRAGIEQVQQAFGPGEVTPILVAVRTADPRDRILSPQHLETLYPLVVRLTQDPRVAGVRSLLNVAPQFTLEDYQRLYQQPTQSLPPALAAAVSTTSSPSMMLIAIRSKTLSHDTASHALVQELRSQSLPGLKIQVGGQTAREIDLLQSIVQRFPLALAGIVGVTFLVLCLLLHSVVLPIKAILMNVLSIGASFGALVFIFQEGHFQKLLNFTPLGYLDILLPLVLFCVVFGLSMDYEVFLLTRIKESYDICGDNTKSVIEGLERTGWIITSAASLMIIVTGTFTFTSIIFIKALGLGIAIAVLVDATLIRVILVPATMHLFGHWNWWIPEWSRLTHRIKPIKIKGPHD
jgi:putative drug exporter of the RND superfamily